MKKAIWLVWPMIILLCGPVSADFYKYKDKDGNIRFTDDIGNVPKDQRPDVQSYEESPPSVVPPPDSNSKKRSDAESPNEILKDNVQGDADAGRIKTKKAELDKTYQALMEEKKQLNKEKENLRTRKEINAYNRKIAEHNEKIYQWEQNRKALNAEVEAYNAKITNKATSEKQ